MIEWILVLTLTLKTAPGEVRDIAPQIVPEFSSRQACEDAGIKLAERLIVLAGKTREQQGIPGHTSKSGPMINYECVQIHK
jgi:hypothetical protein